MRGADLRAEVRFWNKRWAGVRLTGRVGVARVYAVLRRTVSGIVFPTSEYETVRTTRAMTGGLAAGPVFRGGRFTISPGARWDVIRPADRGFIRSSEDELLWVPASIHGLYFELALALDVLRRPRHRLLLTMSTLMGVTVVNGRRTAGAYGIELGLLVATWSSPD